MDEQQTQWVHSREYGWGIVSERDPASMWIYERGVGWVERPVDEDDGAEPQAVA